MNSSQPGYIARLLQINKKLRHMTVIPEFRRYTREFQEFKANLSYIMSSSTAWAMYNTISKR